MTSLTWHLWTCPNCGTRAAVLIDSRMTCNCGTATPVDTTFPLVTDVDFENESLWQ